MSRFYVLERAGYLSDSPDAAVITVVMVLDSDYCHRVVWSSYRTPTIKMFTGRQIGTARRWPLETRRAFAARLAERLNAGEDVRLPIPRLWIHGRVPRLRESVSTTVARFIG